MTIDIEKLLKLEKWEDSEKEFIKMLICNRITHHLGDEDGAAVGSRNFDLLAEDILRWRDTKIGTTGE